MWWNEEVKKVVKNKREAYDMSLLKNLPGEVKDRIKQVFFFSNTVPCLTFNISIQNFFQHSFLILPI